MNYGFYIVQFWNVALNDRKLGPSHDHTELLLGPFATYEDARSWGPGVQQFMEAWCRNTLATAHPLNVAHYGAFVLPRGRLNAAMGYSPIAPFPIGYPPAGR